jgi:hypothetical protein
MLCGGLPTAAADWPVVDKVGLPGCGEIVSVRKIFPPIKLPVGNLYNLFEIYFRELYYQLIYIRTWDHQI